MNTNKLLIFSLILLLILNAICLNQVSSSRKKAETLQNTLNQKEVSHQNNIDFYESIIRASTSDVKVSIEVINGVKEQYPERKQLLEIDENKVVFFFNEGSCGSCILKAFQDLLALSENISPDNILVFTPSKYESDLVDPESYEFPVFYVESLGLNSEELNQPFIFMANSKWEVQSMFFPDLFEDMRYEYFGKILPKYFLFK
ncbi:hypothetical protein BXY85_1321 [Roseivirga pacifica]|uniref:Uncharacterized protein n=1 Tax=Roseivirga pacifica TaxID=1267423 RepID=A0A1I0MDE3_9BACT|nr:hypothetical protein [Roseivirga pacifica]RKQ50307.1 hypothetical protein BXY85_1321 [Roseivirga pacifica]SEV86393.1 hypothetical protein SAMN05216290_0305 [Roseivirga pacifica]